MELLSLKKTENTLVLEVQSPHNANALSRKLVSELSEVITQVSALPPQEARALVLLGSETSFCAGADLKERAGMSTEEVHQFLKRLRELLSRWENLPFPTIAVLEGPAFGGGLEWALCCDIRILEENVSLGLTETKLGIIPGAGGTQRLTRLVGMGKAKEWIYSAKKLTSNEAFQFGLVEQMVTKGKGREAGMQLALEIATSAPIAVRQAKLAIQQGWDMKLEKGLDWEKKCYDLTLSTIDRTEALTAFKEKRKPNFQGK